MRYEKGQMAQLDYTTGNNHSTWQYLVCIDTFDNKTLFAREHGGRFMLTTEESDDTELIGTTDNPDIKISPLYKNGQPVFSKRSFFGFGRYTFEPKTKGGK